jgi:glycine cleavage system transcriptional repressor
MALLAVTVIGRDRPGIIAQATGALADLGGNLEDSTMTILRGHFTMVLLVTTDADRAAAEQALAHLAADGTLQVAVREVPTEAEPEPTGVPYLLSLHGADRPGIVSAVTALIAAVGGNITDFSTRLTGSLYVLIAEVDLPVSADVAAVTANLERVAGALGVDASLRPLEPDVL